MTRFQMEKQLKLRIYVLFHCGSLQAIINYRKRCLKAKKLEASLIMHLQLVATESNGCLYHLKII